MDEEDIYGWTIVKEKTKDTVTVQIKEDLLLNNSRMELTVNRLRHFDKNIVVLGLTDIDGKTIREWEIDGELFNILMLCKIESESDNG